MATSGSYNFSVTRDDIIKDAMEEIGALEEGETPSADETTLCARRLNIMVKRMMTKGYNLWAIEDAVMFQTLGAQSYRLGNASTDAEWCLADDYNSTTTSVAAIIGAGSLTLTTAGGVANGDRIGIQLDTGALQWTTVNGAPVGNVVTLANVLTAAVTSGNTIFSYTTRPVRPLRMIPLACNRRDISGGDTPIELIGKPEYESLTSKQQRGKTIQMCYLPTLDHGMLWTWLTADLVTDTLRFSYERPLQDFDLTTDNPDFPVEASEMLYLGLALKIAGPFSASDEVPRIKTLYDEAEDDFFSWNQEQAPVKFQPDLRNFSRSGRASRRW